MGTHPAAGLGVLATISGVTLASYVSFSVTVVFVILCLAVVAAAAVRRRRDRGLVTPR